LLANAVAAQVNPNSYNQSVMVRQLEAVYEGGVLRPLEPLALSEHQRVRLTLDDPAPAQNGVVPVDAVNEHREEFRWLAERSGPYAGQWVALDGPRLVAHGAKLAAVSEAARAAGVERPLFASVPDDNMPFGGW